MYTCERMWNCMPVCMRVSACSSLPPETWPRCSRWVWSRCAGAACSWCWFLPSPHLHRNGRTGTHLWTRSSPRLKGKTHNMWWESSWISSQEHLSTFWCIKSTRLTRNLLKISFQASSVLHKYMHVEIKWNSILTKQQWDKPHWISPDPDLLKKEGKSR